MIVLPDGPSLLLITQPDHAALARRLMDQWQANGLAGHPRRDSILHAVEQHDNGWRELDAAPTLLPGTGRIADFMTMPPEVKQSVWPRGVERLAGDPWAAALVAQHAIHIYSGQRPSAEWTPFFAEMEALRARHLDRAQAPLESLYRDYAFVRLADLVSLVFCNRWTDEKQDFGYTLAWRDGEVVITPDPFGGTQVTMSVPARELPNRAFLDANDLAAAWRDARPVMVSSR